MVEENHALFLLNTIHQAMVVDDLDFSIEHARLKEFAIKQADICKVVELNSAITLFEKYQLGKLAYTELETKNRLQDAKFWLRRIRRKTASLISQVERALGYVSKRRAVYCGDVSLNRHRQNQLLSQQYMQNTYLQNDEGFSIPLSEIAEHNISNPVIRRNELMVRIRGFEEVAQYCGHAAVFATLTTPSRMHATNATGIPNQTYDGSSINDAQDYLNHVWQLCRAKFDREEIKPYGFRVVEPHHDGTPHWHLLLFMPLEQIKHFKEVLTHYGLQDSPDEKGARQYRVKFIDIDPSKGSAAGYIAKYISKNIDGFAVGNDTSGQPSNLVAARINAWSKSANIRQFQQIGGPSVTVWRELRKLSSADEDVELNDAYSAADSSSWAAFCIAMNAIDTPRKEHAISPFYETKTAEHIDYQTGEITANYIFPNRYNEPRKPTIAGLKTEKTIVKTRTTKWHLLPQPPSRDIPRRPLGRLGVSSEGVSLDLCK
ncbi:replication endonuclease [Rheinheimera riviphila]|uniref:Replication endonuclease n=1 Tax=Rheinheimera riviphila TaxID=1834037 RepID=A0A437QFD3_9GAMM|nr:replication endonuclease [Rheinheimera riviphila]RVU33247.1 replication endonuclease [Rheinheimera riviphila]